MASVDAELSDLFGRINDKLSSSKSSHSSTNLPSAENETNLFAKTLFRREELKIKRLLSFVSDYNQNTVWYRSCRCVLVDSQPTVRSFPAVILLNLFKRICLCLSLSGLDPHLIYLHLSSSVVVFFVQSLLSFQFFLIHFFLILNVDILPLLRQPFFLFFWPSQFTFFAKTHKKWESLSIFWSSNLSLRLAGTWCVLELTCSHFKRIREPFFIWLFHAENYLNVCVFPYQYSVHTQ